MTGDDPDLDTELAEARLDAAVDARRRRRAEAELAAMEASLAMLLAGWAAVGAAVVVETGSGRVHSGRVLAVGEDVVMLEAIGGRVAIRLSAVGAVSTAAEVVIDSRPSAVGTTTMLEVIAGLAGTRETITVVRAGGAQSAGEIDWCGDDVACLSTTERGGRLYVSVASLNEVSFSASSA
ncbi:MAG TPA: hypothetical protein VJM33_02455 [Microthrixaceae bacterium]|nr:hypothetical protein [Microthrixaceae bacterium]